MKFELLSQALTSEVMLLNVYIVKCLGSCDDAKVSTVYEQHRFTSLLADWLAMRSTTLRQVSPS